MYISKSHAGLDKIFILLGECCITNLIGFFYAENMEITSEEFSTRMDIEFGLSITVFNKGNQVRLSNELKTLDLYKRGRYHAINTDVRGDWDETTLDELLTNYFIING